MCIKKNNRKYGEKLYANKCSNLVEMKNFLKDRTIKSQQGEIESLRRPVSTIEFAFVI